MPHIAVKARGTIDIQKLLDSSTKSEVKLGLKMREVDLDHGNNDSKLQRKEAEHLSPRYRKQYEKLIAAASDKEPVAAKSVKGGGQGAMSLMMAEKSGGSSKARKGKGKSHPGAAGVRDLFRSFVVPQAPNVPASYRSNQDHDAAYTKANHLYDAIDSQFDDVDRRVDAMLTAAYGPKKGAQRKEDWKAICEEGAKKDVDPERMASVVERHWPGAPQAIKNLARSRRGSSRQLSIFGDKLDAIACSPVQLPPRPAAPRVVERERVVYRAPPKRDFVDKCGDVANSAVENFGVAGFVATYPAGMINFFFGK